MEKTQSTERLAYSIQETATAIGVSSRVVHDFVKNGSLAHFRIGTRVLIPVDELKAFIEQRTQKSPVNN